jgi:pyruvate dehydrogenase E1 component alpha subunit
MTSPSTPLPSTEALPDAAHVRELLRQMVLIRRFEEKCAELYGAGTIRGFLHLAVGEEAIATGVIPALGPEDAIVATYREHGHALVRGVSPEAVMAEMYGHLEGCSRGRGGSMHLFDAATRFYGGNAIVGGGLPIAVGLALADKMAGRPPLTACFFGDGAVAEGVFYESVNLASLWHLPLLLCCENNRYAMGTALERSQAETSLAAKAAVHQVPVEVVDGMDVLACEAAARRAVEAVRTEGGPRFLELLTYRFRAHSMFDPELYRAKEEVERWKQRDPIPALWRRAREAELLPEGELNAIEGEVAAEIEAAVEFAEGGGHEPVEELHRFVYSEEDR